MLFGDRSTFAIEAMVEPHLQAPSTMWGRMCIWCDGVCIGNFAEEHCGLYDSYDSFRSLLASLHSLWRVEFADLSDRDLWNLLDEKLYGYHGDVAIEDDRTMEELLQDAHTYGPFNFLTNWGEQFDRDGKSFIVCSPDQQIRILNLSLPPSKGISLRASMLPVSASIRSFLRWFESEAARLGHPVT